MHLDLKTIQVLSVFVLFGIFYMGRMAKGTAHETPEGMSFGTKPIVSLLRFVGLPAYFVIMLYPRWVQHHSLPLVLYLLLVALFVIILIQLPGTIILTPTAVMQRFWLRPIKTIQYREIMAVEELPRGNTKVLGDNRVTIIHTFNHCASQQFREEIARRKASATSPR